MTVFILNSHSGEKVKWLMVSMQLQDKTLQEVFPYPRGFEFIAAGVCSPVMDPLFTVAKTPGGSGFVVKDFPVCVRLLATELSTPSAPEQILRPDLTPERQERMATKKLQP